MYKTYLYVFKNTSRDRAGIVARFRACGSHTAGQQVRIHPKQPMRRHNGQAFPWFSSVPEQMLSCYSNPALFCMLLKQPLQRYQNFFPRQSSEYINYFNPNVKIPLCCTFQEPTSQRSILSSAYIYHKDDRAHSETLLTRKVFRLPL